MAQTAFNEQIERLLFSEQESGHDPFWGDLIDVENEISEFDILDDLLGSESKERFRKEHLQRYDEGRQIPPDVMELHGILRNWLEEYGEWSKVNFNPKDFVEHNYIFIWTSEWLKMIENYYPNFHATGHNQEHMEIPQKKEEMTWEVPQGMFQSFSPMKPLADKKILEVLQNDDYGIFPADLTVEYLRWSIQRAQYGRLLSYAKIIKRSSDFKAIVNTIVKAYYPQNDEYTKVACESMGIKGNSKYALGKSNTSLIGETLLKELRKVVKN